MAEAKSVYQDDVICRYFLSGICKDGEKCIFPHDRTRHIPDSVCRYYLKGTCAFGQNCIYDHSFVNGNAYSLYESISSDRSKFSVNHSATSSSTLSETEKKMNTPEFEARYIRSYSDIVKGEINNEKSICPLFAEGECPYVPCELTHGNMCELCQKAYLHPFNEKARKSHIEKCEKKFGQKLKYSFDIQDSMKKTCGICRHVVLEKEPITERRFGILENCNHVYCLSCIRKWRQTRPYESNLTGISFDPIVTRACPECRIVSDFITPSAYFVDTGEEKQKFISEYKKVLNKIHCKYFNKGVGICRLGGSCFYLHAEPDGTKVDLPLPERRSMKNEDGELQYIKGVTLTDTEENNTSN